VDVAGSGRDHCNYYLHRPSEYALCSDPAVQSAQTSAAAAKAAKKG